jgi:hypothetical protein
MVMYGYGNIISTKGKPVTMTEKFHYSITTSSKKEDEDFGFRVPLFL